VLLSRGGWPSADFARLLGGDEGTLARSGLEATVRAREVRPRALLRGGGCLASRAAARRGGGALGLSRAPVATRRVEDRAGRGGAVPAHGVPGARGRAADHVRRRDLRVSPGRQSVRGSRIAPSGGSRNTDTAPRRGDS